VLRELLAINGGIGSNCDELVELMFVLADGTQVDPGDTIVFARDEGECVGND